MGFFEAPETAEEDTDEFEPPAWNAPPRRVLGRVVPLGIFVAQSDQVVIALTYATAYPTGCLLALEISGRRGEMDPREWWGIGQNTLHRPFGMNNLLGELPDGLIRFGVRFADGSKATTVDSPARFCSTPGDPPDGPVLTDHHWGTSIYSGPHGFEVTRQLWLWPVPAPEPFEFAVEWPLLGIPLTFVPLDGAALAAAAQQAQPYWT